jgi:hypothetical protein
MVRRSPATAAARTAVATGISTNKYELADAVHLRTTRSTSTNIPTEPIVTR